MSRESLTIDAAHRLIRTRYRQYILQMAAAVERGRHGDNDQHYDHVLDTEKTIEAAAEASWRSTLRLWSGAGPCMSHEAKRSVCVCIDHGLAKAVERSTRFVLEYEVEYENDRVQDWARTFISEFKPESLLDGVPCASAI
jgi:hypothetical protein